jgi:hypothetical protein
MNIRITKHDENNNNKHAMLNKTVLHMLIHKEIIKCIQELCNIFKHISFTVKTTVRECWKGYNHGTSKCRTHLLYPADGCNTFLQIVGTFQLSHLHLCKVKCQVCQINSLIVCISVCETFVPIRWHKGKVHPGSGHEGPKGEYRSRSILSLTAALDGGGWWTSRLINS